MELGALHYRHLSGDDSSDNSYAGSQRYFPLYFRVFLRFQILTREDTLGI